MVNSLHVEMVCRLPFTNVEINFISLRPKWQALPSNSWAVPRADLHRQPVTWLDLVYLITAR